MSKKEKTGAHNLSLAEQLQRLNPDIKKIQENIALRNRVWEIYKSISEFHWSRVEEVWPEAERSALTEKLLSGDDEALKKLEEMEKHWLDN